MVAFFFDAQADLVGHGGGDGVAPRGVLEDEGVVELDAFDGGFGLLVVVVGFAGEADDDVGGDGEVWPGFAHGFAEVNVFFVLVGAAHEGEDAIAAALHGEVDVAAEFGQVGVGADEVFAEADGVR